MKKIILGLIATLFIIGCSSDKVDTTNIEAKLVVGKSLESLALNDQFDKPQALKADTKILIFAFSKDMAHICNDYFVTQAPTYLADNNAQFVADVSAAPSIIRNMFILPGLKDFKHTVLLLDDKTVAVPYRKDVDVEKIVIVYINNKSITEIKTISTEAELKETI